MALADRRTLEDILRRYEASELVEALIVSRPRAFTEIMGGEHRFPLESCLKYKARPNASTMYVVKQQVTRLSLLGQGLSYHVRELVDERPTGKRLEIDECELEEAP
jgi:hypothetical protein